MSKNGGEELFHCSCSEVVSSRVSEIDRFDQEVFNSQRILTENTLRSVLSLQMEGMCQIGMTNPDAGQNHFIPSYSHPWRITGAKSRLNTMQLIRISQIPTRLPTTRSEELKS